MDINALLDPSITDEEVDDHVLGNTLLEIAKVEEAKRVAQNRERAIRINASEAEGNFGSVGSKIKATLDENGSVSVTNIGTSTRKQIASLTGDDATEALSVNNIDSRLKSLGSFDNAVDASVAHGSLLSELEVMKTNTFNTAKTRAEVSQNVPALEANLARLQRLDQAEQQRNPDKSLGASNATVQGMQLLETARSNAGRLAEDAVTSNITLNSLQAKVNAAKPILQSAFTKQQASDIRVEEKLAREEAKTTDLINSIPVSTLNRVKLLKPSMTDKDAANFLVSKRNKSPEEFQVLTTPLEDLPNLAVQGNKQAATLFIEEESKKTNTDPLIVQRDLKELSALVNNDKLLKQQARRLFGDKSPEVQQITQASSLVGIGSKDQQASAQALKFSLARNLMSLGRTRQFESDVTQWGVSGLEEAVGKASSLGQAPSMENVMLQFLSDSVGEDRITKVQEFAQILRKAGEGKSTSTLGSINVDLMINKLARFNANPSFLDKVRLSQQQGIIDGNDPDKGFTDNSFFNGSFL